MKRIALAAAALSIAAVGAFTAPVSAADCVVSAHVYLDLNGEPVEQDVCLPPAE